ncbi:DDE-type integrase/transposase/recombinase [Nitrospira sp. Nam74]
MDPEKQLEDYFQCVSLSDEAKALIRTVWCSPPARRVASGRGNVCGRYPSRKNGVSIQFESHKVEKRFLILMEYDTRVRGYRDQVLIKLMRTDAQGRPRAWMTAVDYVSLRDDGAVFVECKKEEELQRLSQDKPDLYLKDADGKWRCPPGEAYAAQFGMRFEVVSSADLNPVLDRNITFLEDYLSEEGWLSEGAQKKIQDLVRAKVGITLRDMLPRLDRKEIDTLYGLIACGQVWADLHRIPLAEFDRVQLYESHVTGEAHNIVLQTVTVPQELSAFIEADVQENMLRWEGKSWSVVATHSDHITLLGDGRSLQLRTDEYERLLKNGNIQLPAPAQNFGTAFDHRLAKARPEDLTVANRRYAAVFQLRGMAAVTGHVPSRTYRRWKAKYRHAEQVSGCGFQALIPRTSERGNRRRKLSEAVIELMHEVASTYHVTPEGDNKTLAYGHLKNACDERKIPVPSSRTFSREIARLPRVDVVRKQKGDKAAYQFELPLHLFYDTPIHGDRPFEIVHIDHTLVDVMLVCSVTGEFLGRPWLTLAMCAFSRRILAIYLSFDPPSCASVMMVLRIMVRRFGRRPHTIITDGGKEFHSIYYETFLNIFKITQKTRPPAKPRFGSVIERIFGTANSQLFHRLIGNTKLTKIPRQLTKKLNPCNLAVWHLVGLYDELQHWAYDTYDTMPHSTLGTAPRDLFERTLELTGFRTHRRCAYDETFRILTLPPCAVRKVVPGQGIKVNQIWYSAPALSDPQVEGATTVRRDPFDIGHIYAFVNKRWVECLSSHYLMLRGHTERERELVSAELRQLRRLGHNISEINSAILAREFQKTTKSQAHALQVKKDREQANALNRLEGTSTPLLIDGPAAQGPRAEEVQSLIVSRVPLLPDPSTLTTYGDF